MGEGAVWKAVAGFGGVLLGAGVAAMALALDVARVLMAGGCAVFLLGLALYWHDRWTWVRKPRLPRGLETNNFPAIYDPQATHPHAQEVDILIFKPKHPPDFRIFCNAPVLRLEAEVEEFEPMKEGHRAITSVRQVVRYHIGVAAISSHFPPLEPIQPPAFLRIRVYSDGPIRVLRVKHLKKAPYPSARPAETQQGQ